MNIDFSKMTNEEVKELAFDTLVDIKQAVFSTVNAEGNATSRIIEVMHREENALYFLTCNIKPFYFELMNNKKISIAAMTKGYMQVRLEGSFKGIENEALQKIVEENPSFGELGLIGDDSNNIALFCIEEGKGEIFDLSADRVKMQRARYSFGGSTVNKAGCIITESCINCGKCAKACPFGAITKGEKYHEVNETLCDECGVCYHICPVKAIELPKGM